MTRAALAAVALLAACSGPQTVALPDGRQAHIASCDGYGHSMVDCMNAAGATCRGAYAVLGQQESDDGEASLPFSNGSVVTVPIVHRSLTFICPKD